MRVLILILCLSACISTPKEVASNPKWERVIKSQKIESGLEIPSYNDITIAQNKCNAIRFAPDTLNWGMNDYWATPKEFFQKNGGDCEDYAICKYYELRKAGFTPENLKILIGYEKILHEDHAVLKVTLGGESLILDYVNKDILKANEYIDKYFSPAYEVNENSLKIY